MVPVPSVRLAAGAVLAQTVTLALLFAVSFGLLADADPFDGSLRDFAVLGLIHGVNAALVVGLGLVLLGGRSLQGLGWAADPQLGRSLALGTLGALACVVLVASWGLVFGGLPGFTGAFEAFATMPPEQRLLCVGIGLGAAFIEESVFRGTLQPALVARLGRPAGIALGAVIFSAYHLKFGLVGFVTKALFGCVFGALKESTGRLWAPALAHAGVWMVVGFA